MASASTMVFAFVMDMIGSTKLGLSLSNVQFRDFNEALVTQICPHLAALELEPGPDVKVKFTGDG